MVIIAVKSGLGNQMFQYALFLSMKKMGIDVRLDLSLFDLFDEHNGYELKTIFNVDEIVADKKDCDLLSDFKMDLFHRICRKINKKSTFYVQKEAIVYYPEIFKLNDVYLYGYWQSEKYFKNISDVVKKVYQFKPFQSQIDLDIANKILTCKSVSLHVRRGDYLKESFFQVCNVEYYMNAINLITKNVYKPVFFVFSDDIFWCKQIFKGDNFIFVDHNHGVDSYKDMQLMTLCNHNIIANSSFSWWGAWLGMNKDKIVIAPRKWFNTNELFSADIIPDEWARL